jgi:hypothetical protein
VTACKGSRINWLWQHLPLKPKLHYLGKEAAHIPSRDLSPLRERVAPNAQTG